MAHIYPSLVTFHPASLGQWREAQVLHILQDGLPDTFSVFHSVNWSTLHHDTQWFGEIDAVILAPNDTLVLLEIKAGPVEITDADMIKRYGDGAKSVARQTRQQYAALRDRLQRENLPGVHLSQLVVLPDARVEHGTVAFPRERIVDAAEMDALCQRVREAVPAASPHPVDRGRLERFLLDRFDLAPDPTARVGQVTRAVTALADGLARWVPRIHHPAGLYHIQATAGSGKTQLALRLLQDAADQNLRARYVCFNRPLADHIIHVASPKVEVSTFHELAHTHWQRTNGDPDFTQDGLFDRMVQTFIEGPPHPAPFLDLLIIDESQDFESAWIETLSAGLKDDGRLYVLGDTNQTLYPRDSWGLPEATTITVDENFRSPQAIVQIINLLKLTPQPIVARCPIKGDVPGFHPYDPDRDPGGVQATDRLIQRLLAEGHPPEQIAILSLAGLDKSLLLKQDSLAHLALRKFTGRFDANGGPQWTEGALLAETLYRFKGQAAPVIVLGEIDCTELTESLRRKLFVGFTRAQYRLECVLSVQAERALVSQL